MQSLRRTLMGSSALSLALGLGVALYAADGAAACGPCDPCAPMEAAACGPCDPCAPMEAAGCGPCDPCAPAAAAGTECFVPRLQEAAAEACGACDPCAAMAAACGPCDPCAPMAAAADPCAACNSCAPMAAACDPCAPMAAAACDPCAPMEAAACDPCAPAMACGPCDPCGPCAAAAPPPEMSDEELTELYDCLLDHMRSAYGDAWIDMAPGFAALEVQHLHLAAYGDSGLDEATAFVDWPNVARVPYESGTHGGRLVTNHVNPVGEEAYRRYEDIDGMPVGGIVAKPSFTISAQGEALLGPLFLMEKMEAGWNEESADWRYTSVMPDGTTAVRTLGENAEGAVMCAECHMAMGGDQDSLLFLPEEYRAQ